MRFYRVVYYNSQKGTVYGWFLSKREARAEARKFLRAFHADPGASIKVEAVDIPGYAGGCTRRSAGVCLTQRQRIAPDDPGKPQAHPQPA